MAFTTGLEGLLSSSDSGKDLHWLIETGTDPYSVNLNVTNESFDATAFASTAPIAMSKIGGLAAWTGQFNAKFPKTTKASGHEGLVTYANGYVLGCEAWSITATAQSFDSTSFASTPPTWREFLPGLYSFSGSFDVKIDDTTALVLPNSGDATFRLTKEATNDNVLAGNIVITGMSPQITVGGKNVARYTFDVNGNLTTDGDSSFLEVSSPGTPLELVRPEVTAITARASGSRTYSGNAFLTNWTVGASLGSPVEASASFQGTGALTIG